MFNSNGWNIWATPFYDGEPVDKTVTDPPNNPPPPNTKTYTQEEYEKAINAEKQRANNANKATLAELTKLRETAQLTENERTTLNNKINELEASLMTKEELAQRKIDELNNKAKNDLDNSIKESTRWKGLFETSLIDRALLDAAVKENAFDPGVFAKLLKDNVSILSDEAAGTYKVVVKLNSRNKEGKPVELTLSPDDAIKHLKEQPQYGYLFKGTNTSGTGGNNNMTGDLAKLDLSAMSLEDYRKYREQLMK